MSFELSAEVRSANVAAVEALLHELLPGAAIERGELGLLLRAQLDGESARDLNRWLLSALRRVQRRTTLRAEWTGGGVVERFFDYASKGTRVA